jgi:hypothetical protein
VLSLTTSSWYLPVSVVRQEMQAWRFVHLNPEELRKPSAMGAPGFLSPQGGNLPTMLARMQKEDEFVLTDIARDMSVCLRLWTHCCWLLCPYKQAYQAFKRDLSEAFHQLGILS